MSISCAVCWSVDYRSLQIALSSPVSVPFHRSYPERVTRDALHLLREGPDLIRSERSWSDSGQLEGRRELGIERGRRFFSILFFCIVLFEFLAGVVAASSDVARVGWYEWFRCQHTHGLRDSMLGEIIFPTMGPPTYQKISMIKRCQYQAIRHSFLNLSDIFRNDFDSFWQKSAH